ncbi:DUF2591 domain-containing protein [Pseudomonas sp. S 311-6]|uniref:phage protein NinX family protein n=1 Tax=Pseudomonas TaxID=286 RepID=UPI0020977738|nr:MULTISPECIES: phage protein NinX family protein [Pseudomonas]MCO7566391.1 DUF2591 domain-containing protein [Pseudomonas mosselii]MCO7617419.1 DUF2591 domain-containing protein [Pseudomonas guariconensis]MCO7640697.1 DUF2591 domain-containing protein [Pseudomonas sp. S 311-6]
MTDLIEVKTADLDGEALGWAVGKAEGLDLYLEPPGYNGVPWRVFARHQGQAIGHSKRYNPWEDWALGGKLVEKHGTRHMHFSQTPLACLCRGIVNDLLGDTVQVPKELIDAD